MSIPPLATPITPGNPSANDSGPVGMTFANPPISINSAPAPVAPVGAVAILVAMEDVSESSQRVKSENPAPASVWNGREVGPIERPLRHVKACSNICLYILAFFTLTGLTLGILGAIYVSNNSDPGASDSRGHYLNRIGKILLIVGWTSCFCCGVCLNSSRKLELQATQE